MEGPAAFGCGRIRLQAPLDRISAAQVLASAEPGVPSSTPLAISHSFELPAAADLQLPPTASGALYSAQVAVTEPIVRMNEKRSKNVHPCRSKCVLLLTVLATS